MLSLRPAAVAAAFSALFLLAACAKQEPQSSPASGVDDRAESPVADNTVLAGQAPRLQQQQGKPGQALLGRGTGTAGGTGTGTAGAGGAGTGTAGELGQALRGAQALFSNCQSCHGLAAEGNRVFNAPALSRLDADYLKRQLSNFQAGIRGSHPKDIYGTQMQPMAKLLTQADIDEVVAYITALPKSVPVGTINADLARGRDYYNMICGSCHGPRAEGNAIIAAPALAGVNDWYLLRQFENFRQGIRGSEERDQYGLQMRSMAQTLPDMETARSVIAYIQSLAEKQ